VAPEPADDDAAGEPVDAAEAAGAPQAADHR
jgi:hypothetical protein